MGTTTTLSPMGCIEQHRRSTPYTGSAGEAHDKFIGHGLYQSAKYMVGFSFFFYGLLSSDVSMISGGVPPKPQKTKKNLHFR
jgi:hypothetical protein